MYKITNHTFKGIKMTSHKESDYQTDILKKHPAAVLTKLCARRQKGDMYLNQYPENKWQSACDWSKFVIFGGIIFYAGYFMIYRMH